MPMIKVWVPGKSKKKRKTRRGKKGYHRKRDKKTGRFLKR
jgi:hypothetical protein